MTTLGADCVAGVLTVGAGAGATWTDVEVDGTSAGAGTTGAGAKVGAGTSVASGTGGNEESATGATVGVLPLLHPASVKAPTTRAATGTNRRYRLLLVMSIDWMR